MNVLIVENEKPAAGILVRLLHHIDPAIQVSGIVETVEGTINWIQDHDRPDLILMDIQLDDGLCFEVFETIRLDIPVIFTTAYDEYTLRAFKVNSIDYLLKPVEEQALRAALRKYRGMYASGMVARPDFDRLLGGYSSPYKSRFLVK
ncbi:MAG TPA: DNA-binding response regulator, partial [Bacteroidales bacterium]|nr:DNA-binding response regulator [Bacteroidales bacterium]